jgi:hypothetical protein
MSKDVKLLNELRDRIGRLSIMALETGGEALLEKVERNMGVAIRHSERIAKGILPANDQVLAEMKHSLDMAELTLGDIMEAKGKKIG